jgi:hypothetical protein
MQLDKQINNVPGEALNNLKFLEGKVLEKES